MKTRSSSGKKRLFIVLFALSLCALPGLSFPGAQAPAAGQENTFDYTPENGDKAAPAVKPQTRANFADVKLIRTPDGSAIYIYKHRWKDWLERALYIILLSIAVLAILASLPKNDEANIIISYFLSGVSFMLANWILLCAILLLKDKSPYGLYILPVSAAMWVATYYLLMKIKKADVSLADLKDSFRQQSASDGADQRLASLDGSPGDWPEQDFLK